MRYLKILLSASINLHRFYKYVYLLSFLSYHVICYDKINMNYENYKNFTDISISSVCRGNINYKFSSSVCFKMN